MIHTNDVMAVSSVALSIATFIPAWAGTIPSSKISLRMRIEGPKRRRPLQKLFNHFIFR
ncbi:MAG: hypothetical protein JWP25_3508 [Bradyrhizobium sp.]|nr:hypothetical protein [Bradyrhizobium sp.]